MAEKEMGKELRPGEVSAYWTAKADDWIMSHPGDFFKLTFKKLYYFLGPREISNNRDLPTFFARVPFLHYNPLGFGLILALALLGIGLTIRANLLSRYLALFVGIFGVASALFFVNSRFRLPVIPLLLVPGAQAIAIIVESARHRRLKAASLVVVGVLLWLICSHPWIRFPAGANSQPLISQGLYYYSAGDYTTALTSYRQAMAMDSTFPELNLNTGACFLRLGKLDSAMTYFERERRLHPERAKAYTNIASIQFLAGATDEARQEIQRALSLRPYDITANRLLIRITAKDTSLSVERLMTVCEDAIRNTDTALVVLNEAAGSFLQRNDLDRAEAMAIRGTNAVPPPIETDDGAFDRNFSDSPENFSREKARSWYLLSAVSGLRGLYAQTIRYAQTAIEHDSDLVDAYRNLIAAYQASGRMSDADAVNRIAVARFPQLSAPRRPAGTPLPK